VFQLRWKRSGNRGLLGEQASVGGTYQVLPDGLLLTWSPADFDVKCLQLGFHGGQEERIFVQTWGSEWLHILKHLTGRGIDNSKKVMLFLL